MTLSPEQIPDRMQRLHHRGRVTNACLAAVFALIAVYYGVQTVEATGVLRAIACALISAGNAYWSYLAVSASRPYRPSALASDEPLRTSVRFYRQVLQDSLDASATATGARSAGRFRFSLASVCLPFSPQKKPSKTLLRKLPYERSSRTWVCRSG